MTKTVHSVAQPIVCCMGTSVAGQATQFLFERAIVDQGSDWRAISVEVSPARFATACDGMLAMQFQALRLFGDLQSHAVSILAAEERAAQFIGKLTTGVRQDDRWVLWDHVGYAWLDIAHRLSNGVEPILWLHGDSRTTRSTIVALSTLATDGAKWLWTNAPTIDSEASWSQSLLEWQAEGRIQQQLHSESCIDKLSRWAAESGEGKINHPAYANSQDSSSALKQTETNTSLNPNAVEQSGEGRLPSLAFISEEALPDALPEILSGLSLTLITMKNRKLPEAMATARIRAISSAELVVAGEAFDFRRWTGRPVDLLLLQDAYDEYCDF